MYEAFYGLQEKPFTVRPDPSFLYLSKGHKAALSMLEYVFMSQAGFAVVTGDIGSGKTTLVRKLLQSDTPDLTVGLVTNTQVDSFEELLRWILLAFNLDYKDKEKVELFHTLTDFLVDECSEGRRVILIIDEAQHLSASNLEQLRMLSNVNADKDDLLQLILVGQPELRKLLSGPNLTQFVQRIAVDCHLETLDREETAEYIQHRVMVAGGDHELFEHDCYEVIWQASGGIPRLVNLICDTALLFAFAEQHGHVTLSIVKDVIADKRASLTPIYQDRGKVMSLRSS